MLQFDSASKELQNCSLEAYEMHALQLKIWWKKKKLVWPFFFLFTVATFLTASSESNYNEELKMCKRFAEIGITCRHPYKQEAVLQ